MQKTVLVCLSFLYLNISTQDTVKVKTALTPDQEAENAYNAGLESMSKKDFNMAVEQFSKAISY